jgi:DNA-nicking Smr family endonuclease
MSKRAAELLEMILTDGELRRIKSERYGLIYVDLHGLSCKKARRLLSNIINILHGPASIKVIHGYHHGDSPSRYGADQLP